MPRLIICSRCELPKDENEPDDGVCIGHVSMSDIFIPMMRQQ